MTVTIIAAVLIALVAGFILYRRATQPKRKKAGRRGYDSGGSKEHKLKED